MVIIIDNNNKHRDFREPRVCKRGSGPSGMNELVRPAERDPVSEKYDEEPLKEEEL